MTYQPSTESRRHAEEMQRNVIRRKDWIHKRDLHELGLLDADQLSASHGTWKTDLAVLTLVLITGCLTIFLTWSASA